jgi:hypothetical protein
VYFSKESDRYDTLKEAVNSLEWGADCGCYFPIGVYDDESNTIYTNRSPMFMDRNVADLTDYFKLSNPNIRVYSSGSGELKLGRYIERVKPQVGAHVWFYHDGMIDHGNISMVATRSTRGSDGRPIVYYTMGCPFKHSVEYIEVIINNRQYITEDMFRSKKDAEDWVLGRVEEVGAGRVGTVERKV